MVTFRHHERGQVFVALELVAGAVGHGLRLLMVTLLMSGQDPVEILKFDSRSPFRLNDLPHRCVVSRLHDSLRILIFQDQIISLYQLIHDRFSS